MSHKVLALLMAGAIVVSSMWVIQGQLKIGRPLTIKPVIHSYIFENLFNGAQQLRTASTKLDEIPGLIEGMYSKLENARPQVQSGIKSLQGIISGLKTTKEDIEKNQTIVPTIKDPLLGALKTLEDTLPILLGVLQSLDTAFEETVNERSTVIQDLRQKANTAIGSIGGKDILGRDLPKRMDDLGNFLRGLSI
jgi:hypothetical protein